MDRLSVTGHFKTRHVRSNQNQPVCVSKGVYFCARNKRNLEEERSLSGSQRVQIPVVEMAGFEIGTLLAKKACFVHRKSSILLDGWTRVTVWRGAAGIDFVRSALV